MRETLHRIMMTVTRIAHRIGCAVFWTASLGASVSCVAAAGTNFFGFTGREIFPIENVISQLHVADLDGDGLNDIIVVNNARSRINLLYNQTGKTNLTQAAKPAGKREPNELPPMPASASNPLPPRSASFPWSSPI